MEDRSGSPSSLFGDAGSSTDEDVWNPSFREDVFSAWHSDGNSQEFPPSTRGNVSSYLTHPSNTQQRPFHDPHPPANQDFNAFHPSNFQPQAFSPVRDLLHPASNAQTESVPSPVTLRDLEPPSPSTSNISWNVLSSDSEFDVPRVNGQGPRQERRSINTAHHIDTSQRTSSDFVDLTRETDTPPRPSMPSASSQPGPNKRRRVESNTAASSPRGSQRRKTESQNAVPPAVEEVDLRDVDDDKGLSKVLEDQRMATIKAQQEQASRPVKLATLSCVICMEPMTDVTATYCGHLFCHKCLMEALIAGENQGSEPGKGPSKCPVCRKKIKRPGTGKRDTGQVVALEIKVRKRNDKGKGKEQRASTKSQQGPSMKRKDPVLRDAWV